MMQWGQLRSPCAETEFFKAKHESLTSSQCSVDPVFSNMCKESNLYYLDRYV